MLRAVMEVTTTLDAETPSALATDCEMAIENPAFVVAQVWEIPASEREAATKSALGEGEAEGEAATSDEGVTALETVGAFTPGEDVAWGVTDATFDETLEDVGGACVVVAPGCVCVGVADGCVCVGFVAD